MLYIGGWSKDLLNKKLRCSTVKYNEKNYNRRKKEDLYEFPSYDEISNNKRKNRVTSRIRKMKRPSKRAMQWMDDLLAK